MWYVHTIDYNSGLKNNKILIHATTWIKPKDIMLSKVRQTQKGTSHDSTYMRHEE